MATGDTAPPLALPSSPPLLDRSPSNLSSPLSDVEDKDGEPDDMDLEIRLGSIDQIATPKRQENGHDRDSASGSDSEDESKLSEVDVNDSEAETERLYDTPPKSKASSDTTNGAGENGNKQFLNRRGRTFEPSPSKLQQQTRADGDGERSGSDDDSLSEADEEDNDGVSIASSDPDADPTTHLKSPSPSPTKKQTPAETTPDGAPAQITRQDSAESRKRKRSNLAEQSESEEPLRKRTGSIGPPEVEFSADDVVVVDDEGTSTNPQSGDHSAEEDHIEVGARNKPKVAAAEPAVSDGNTRRLKKSRRNGAKKQNSPDEGDGAEPDDVPEGGPENAEEDGGEETVHQAEDDHPEGEAGEEAEAAHRNEEELERKRAAWEELAAIEKQFSNFREKLYQERLEQLNREEAMLTCSTPTHPEYLAMLQCIDERRDDKIRVSTLELQLNLHVLQKRAVAERAQMMSQYYQSVRDSREKVLEQLGQDWHDIQHERRRLANTTPDYGIRYPTSRTQNIRNAIAYNKEVSILSGFAKYVGFPAAPTINGASDDQIENDLDAILRNRQSVSQPSGQPDQAFHRDLAATSLPFGRNIGAAAEQFIEQTPWANPNHPAHHTPRQQPQPEASSSTTTSRNRRHSHQAGGMFSSSTAAKVNGDSPTQMQKSHSSAGHETIKVGKIGPDQVMKREGIAQAS